MQFLKILLWVLVAFSAAMFTLGNWSWVPINLWGGLVAEVNLPFLLLITFLAGMVPTWAYYRATRWRLAQRLAATERVIADLKPVVPMGTTPSPEAQVSAEPQPSPIAPAEPAGDGPAMPIGAAEPDTTANQQPKSKARAQPQASAEPFTLTP